MKVWLCLFYPEDSEQCLIYYRYFINIVEKGKGRKMDVKGREKEKIRGINKKKLK